MTDREKAIVMAYTGIAMLSGDKIKEYYKYLDELYGRTVYTHEIAILDIPSKAKQDFIELCRTEEKEGDLISQSDELYLSALNSIYQKALEDITRILSYLGYVIVYDDRNNVIDIIPKSDVEGGAE